MRGEEKEGNERAEWLLSIRDGTKRRRVYREKERILENMFKIVCWRRGMAE